MALPGRDLLALLAQVARDPVGAGRNNDAIQRFDNSALGQRFGQHADWLFGGDDGMSALDALLLAPKAAAGGVGMGFEGGKEFGKALAGLLYAATGNAIGQAEQPYRQGLQGLGVNAPSLLDILPEGRSARRAVTALDGGEGNGFARALAANEAAASGSKRAALATGATDMALDPTNLLPGPETLIFDGIKAARGARIAEKLLEGVPEAARAGEAAAKIAPSPEPAAAQLAELLGGTAPPPHYTAVGDAASGVDTADFVRDMSNIRPEGHRTYIEQLMADLGETADHEAFGRKMDVAKRIMEERGLDTPMHDTQGFKVNWLDRQALSPEEIYRYRREIGNLNMPTSPRLDTAQMGRLFPPEHRGPALRNLMEPVDEARFPELPTQRVAAPIADAADEAASLIDNAAPATPFAGEYRDFLDLAGTVPGELPPPSSKFWDRLGADPEAVRGFFDQAHREGLMGTTDAGLSALRPVEEFPQAASRAEGLASLTPDEVDVLARVAYPNDRAIQNAARKYPTTAELADAALARIGGSRDALEYIASSNPPLAKKLAYMPGIAHVWPHALATTVGGAGLGGLAGATAGAGAGFVQGDGDFLDRVANAGEGALTGMTIGAGIGGLGGATIGKNTTPEAARLLIQKANAAGVEGTKAAFTGAKTQRLGPRAIASYWAGQVVRHPKNIFNDELWNDLLTGALSSQSRQYIKDVRDSIVQRMNLTDPYARLSSPVRSLLDTFGMTGYLPELGLPMAKAVEDKGLTIGQEIGASTLLSAVNPQGFAQNALGLIAGGPVKGAANTWWRPFFNAVNGSLNQTFREAALVGEGGKFAAKGRQALIDAGYGAFKALPEDGLIHARDVEKLLGTKEARVWQAVQKNAMGLAEGRVRFLYGDYGKKGFVERKLGTVVPFASWAIRAYPVALEMAAEHPLIALGLYRATEALSQGAGEDGRPGYTAGMIPIPDKAGLLTGGQGSTAYLDFIGGISPVGGDMFAPADKGQQPENTYQEISQGLQKLGLPGPNPLVQSLAYIMGFDYKSPGALSRTQGMENALGLVPGNPNLPDIGGGLLRQARSTASPLVAGTEIGALLGAEADTSPSQYDPIGRRFDELVVARTGKRLDDPANKAYLLDLAFGRGDLYEQAERETLLGGAARNIASMSSPVGVATQTEDNRRARAATGKVPFDYGDIAALPQGTAARRQAEAARKAGLAADPWAEPYGIGGRQEARDELMRIIMDRYYKAGIRPTQAGIQEQIRLMEAAAERQRITHP